MRKLLGLLLAAAAAFSMLAVSVSAADYGTAPNYTVENTVTVKTDAVKDALKSSDPTVNIGGGDFQIMKEALSEIAKANKTVTFVADGYTITIDPKDITDSAKAINLKMSVKSAKKVEDIDATAVIIQPSASGNFGFSLTVKIPASAFASAGVSAKNAKAYHVDGNGGITNLPLTANADGSAYVKFDRASYYVITEKALPERTENAVGTAKPVSAGGWFGWIRRIFT